MAFMLESDYVEALKISTKLWRRGPYAHEEPDREQMTALLHILGGGGCYVDIIL